MNSGIFKNPDVVIWMWKGALKEDSWKMLHSSPKEKQKREHSRMEVAVNIQQWSENQVRREAPLLQTEGRCVSSGADRAERVLEYSTWTPSLWRSESLFCIKRRSSFCKSGCTGLFFCSDRKRTFFPCSYRNTLDWQKEGEFMTILWNMLVNVYTHLSNPRSNVTTPALPIFQAEWKGSFVTTRPAVNQFLLAHALSKETNLKGKED